MEVIDSVPTCERLSMGRVGSTSARLCSLCFVAKTRELLSRHSLPSDQKMRLIKHVFFPEVRFLLAFFFGCGVWVVLNGRVLIVFFFLSPHLDGELAILAFAGKEATAEFEVIRRIRRAKENP